MTVGRWFDRAASGWLVFWLAFLAVYIHMGALAFAGLVILLGSVGWVVWIRDRFFHALPESSGLGSSRPNSSGLESSGRIAAVAFALFFGWLALSGFWGGHGSMTAVRLGGQLALTAAIPAYLLTRSERLRDTLAHILMAMAMGGIAILALDVISGFGINLFLDPLELGGDIVRRQSDAEMNIGRGHVVYAVIAPLLFALFMTRLSPPWSIAAISIFTLLLVSGTLLNRLAVAPIILLGAMPFFALALRYPRWGLRLSLSTLCASILFAPMVGVVSRLIGEGVMNRMPMSWDHRLRMWDYSLSQILEAPLIGQGLDSSRKMQDAFTTRIGVDVPFVSLHPHNIGLQTWMEAGAVGALLLSLALAALYRPLRRLSHESPWRAAALSGLISGTAISSAITVGAWQYWWWGLIGLSFALVVLVPREAGPAPVGRSN